MSHIKIFNSGNYMLQKKNSGNYKYSILCHDFISPESSCMNLGYHI
jgi:hypothetical protein